MKLLRIFLIALIPVILIGGILLVSLEMDGRRDANREVAVADVQDSVAKVEKFIGAGGSIEEAMEFTQLALPEDVVAISMGDEWLVHVARDVRSVDRQRGDKQVIYDYGYSSATGEYMEVPLPELLGTLNN